MTNSPPEFRPIPKSAGAPSSTELLGFSFETAVDYEHAVSLYRARFPGGYLNAKFRNILIIPVRFADKLFDDLRIRQIKHTHFSVPQTHGQPHQARG